MALGGAFLLLVQVLLRRSHGPVINLPLLHVLANFVQFLAARPLLPTVYRRIVDEFGNEPYAGRDVYAYWSRHPYELMRCIGFTPDEFDKLLDDIEPQMPQHGGLIDRTNCLLMTLWWLRLYPTLHQISLIFDLHPSTVARHLQHTTQVLHNILHTEIQWPTNAEWRQLR